MYNEELKSRYIYEKNQETTLSHGYLERLFEKTSEMEYEYNKDVRDFTVYEIMEFYKMLNVAVVQSLEVINSHLSMYTQWCLSQYLVNDNQNHYLEIKIEELNSCINKVIFDAKVVTESMILDWVSQLQNPRDQYLLLATFEGLSGQNYCELAKLKPSDVNGNVLSLCTGREIEVSDKLRSIITDCILEDRYYGPLKSMPLIDRGYVLKHYPSVKEDVSDYQIGRNIYRAFARIIDFIGMPSYITINSVSDSGILHMIKKRSKELGMKETEYIYSSYFKEVEEKYNCEIKKSRYILKYKDYLD
jgi:hypothetical protein